MSLGDDFGPLCGQLVTKLSQLGWDRWHAFFLTLFSFSLPECLALPKMSSVSVSHRREASLIAPTGRMVTENETAFHALLCCLLEETNFLSFKLGLSFQPVRSRKERGRGKKIALSQKLFKGDNFETSLHAFLANCGDEYLGDAEAPLETFESRMHLLDFLW